MKTKYILLLALCAIITLSFSFVTVKEGEKSISTSELSSAPAGGLTMGDEL